mmetsp:Transcript_23518/g.39182  ORF Transcript_23518/g.39182 Transcript_23518/m.39182 type:complete len:215 (-) Transcript_23518:1241-1885(-)
MTERNARDGHIANDHSHGAGFRHDSEHIEPECLGVLVQATGDRAQLCLLPRHLPRTHFHHQCMTELGVHKLGEDICREHREGSLRSGLHFLEDRTPVHLVECAVVDLCGRAVEERVLVPLHVELADQADLFLTLRRRNHHKLAQEVEMILIDDARRADEVSQHFFAQWIQKHGLHHIWGAVQPHDLREPEHGVVEVHLPHRLLKGLRDDGLGPI